MPRSARSARPVVGIVAPSGFVADSGVLDRAAGVFAERGWEVEAGESCFARDTRFAGPDDLRAQELQRFCTDRRLALVLAARGGYGLTRLLPRLDFDAIGEAGRLACGYSDFSAFNLALLARTGAMSLHGPSATDFGASVPCAETIDGFFETFDRWRQDSSFCASFEADSPDVNVRGTLWGGNLALVCALLGTPYLPRVRGGILFLEDVNEPAYKIERMLIQLEQANVLQRQSAILLGCFDPVPSTDNDNGFSLETVVNGLRHRLAVPVIRGLPFGHVPSKLTLPYGARATLQVASSRASLGVRG
jgi:muramoyltetrapeptide carboxypeptidase